MSSVETTPLSNDAIDAGAQTDSKELVQWQRRLLPFMTRFIAALAIIFFGLTVFDLVQVRKFMEVEHGTDIRTAIQQQISKESAAIPLLTPDQAYRQSLLLLEADALDRRYHQASALLMSRIWIKQLAFMTGMVMAFLGAIFILGRLSEGRSTISGGVSDWKTTISSSSPGIILAFFGTVLLNVSLLVQTTISVQDSPVYVYGVALKQGASLTISSAGTDEKKVDKAPEKIDFGNSKKQDSVASQPKPEAPK